MSSTNGIHTIQEFYSNLAKKGRLLNHQFGITITRSGMEDIHLYGQSASVPKRGLNKTSVNYFGQSFPIPTTIDEGQTWSLEIDADADNDIFNRFRAWQEEYASWANSGGGNKGISTINVYIDLYNAKMNKIVDTFCLKGVWPEDVDSETLTHDGGAVVSFSVTLSYILSYNSKRGTDPLR